MGVGVDDFRPKKKHAWHYTEIPEDPEVAEIMPGFEIEYMLTDRTVEGNDSGVLGHCIFPPRSGHHKHKHVHAPEAMYVIKGKLVIGVTTEEGDVETVCPAGTALWVKKGQTTWCRNPFDEPTEFIFVYYGVPSLEASGEVDMRPPRKGNLMTRES
ncbi:MAG: cupin domain-containing protein [Spirochaetia bacterium]|jgi:oxalate decarboxylase/phosphoglucose isomerase-like protein (cupin superfamily)